MTTTSTSTLNRDLPTIFRMTQPLVEHRLHEARPVYETRLDSSDVTAEAYRALCNLFATSVNQTSLEPLGLDRQHIIFWLRLTSKLGMTGWHEPPVSSSDVELFRKQQLVIEQAVVAEYATVPEVALIYSDRYLDEHVFTLFITGNQYDDTVMDVLLDREIDLLKRFVPKPLTFHYFPYSSRSPRREMIRETANLIFEG